MFLCPSRFGTHSRVLCLKSALRLERRDEPSRRRTERSSPLRLGDSPCDQYGWSSRYAQGVAQMNKDAPRDDDSSHHKSPVRIASSLRADMIFGNDTGRSYFAAALSLS